MGRNKFSQREIDIICKLLKRKIAGNRGGQKMVRHILRTVLNFNISDFNVLARSDLQSERFKNHCSFGDSEDRLQSEDGLQIRPSETFAMRQHIFSIHYIFMVVQ